MGRLEAMTPRERTLKSIRDGFGGDSYRRREIAPGRYQCGCRWVRAEDVPKAWALGVRADILVLCPLHGRHTAATVRKDL